MRRQRKRLFLVQTSHLRMLYVYPTQEMALKIMSLVRYTMNDTVKHKGWSKYVRRFLGKRARLAEVWS